MGALGRKQAEAFENNRLSIIEATEQLIARRGIEGTSLSDISKTLGISKGTLYYYYPSKEHLIGDIAAHYLERVTDLLYYWIEGVLPGSPVFEVLRRLVACFTADLDHAKTHAVLVKEAAMGNEDISRKFVIKYKEWGVMMEVGLLKASVMDIEKLRSTTYVFFACMEGLINQKLLGAGKLTSEQIVLHFMNVLGLS